MSYIDEFIHTLNQAAPKVKSLLRDIRKVDLQTQQIQVKVQQKRKQFIQNLKMWETKKELKSRKQLEKKCKDIVEQDKTLLQLSKKKVTLAEQLYNYIHEPTQKLDKQLHARGQKFAKIIIQSKGKKGKRKGRPSKEEWQNDPNQPKYCYCGKPSFGEMVMCQNTYCEKQWFHRQCIDQKKLPDKWYCKDCRQKK